MHEAEKLSLEQIEAFLNASQAIRFEGETQKQIYRWIEQVLCQQHTTNSASGAGIGATLPGEDDGPEPGASDAPDRSLPPQRGDRRLLPYRRHRFPQRYTRADIELLAAVDEAQRT